MFHANFHTPYSGHRKFPPKKKKAQTKKWKDKANPSEPHNEHDDDAEIDPEEQGEAAADDHESLSSESDGHETPIEEFAAEDLYADTDGERSDADLPGAGFGHDAGNITPIAPHGPAAAGDLFVGAADPADNVNPAGGSQPILYYIVPFGEIRYYPVSRRFCAHCENPDHGLCRIMKRSYAGAHSAQGRPLGFLMAWLQDCGQKDHKDHLMLTINISWARRQQGRAALREVPGSEALFAQERARRDGEPEEPLECP